MDIEKQLINQLQNSNLKNLITLTYPTKLDGIIKDHLNVFLQNLQTCKKQTAYLYVYKLRKRGNIVIHIVTTHNFPEQTITVLKKTWFKIIGSGKKNRNSSFNFTPIDKISIPKFAHYIVTTLVHREICEAIKLKLGISGYCFDGSIEFQEIVKFLTEHKLH